MMTDQQRWDALGCVGGWVETPNMDRLAAEGVRFSRAYTNSPACVPARVSLAMGRYPHNTGVWHNKLHTVPPKTPTWTRAIKDAGYSTSLFGKLHLHPPRGDLRDRLDVVQAYGFDHVDEVAGPRAAARCRSNLTDRWEEAGVYEAYKRDLRERDATLPWMVRPSPLPLELYPDVYVGTQAAAHLRAYHGSQPWFCWVSFAGPHEPWDTPEPYASRYDPVAMPAPVLPHEQQHQRPRGLLDDKLAAGRFALTPDDIARLRASYAGNVTLIDDQVGEVLRVVEERGDLDRTVVALASDHGEMNGDYGLLYKENFLDPSARIPLIVRLPEGMSGGVSETPVEFMDLGATLLELAGCAPVAGSLARSVVPVLEDTSRSHREMALCEFREEAMGVTADWKVAANSAGEAYMLYDLRGDPHEERNVAGLPEYEQTEHELSRLLRNTIEGAQ